MIHSLYIQNFLSFKEEVQFSFEAKKDSNMEEQHVVQMQDGTRLLKLGIVYGYNASGKSNLIKAFQFLAGFWRTQAPNKNESTGVQAFLFDNETPQQNSYFKMVFYVNQIKYVYQLKINSRYTEMEQLDYYPGTQPANIFHRSYENELSKIDFGPQIKVSKLLKEEINLKTLPNISVFNALEQINAEIPFLTEVNQYLKKSYFNVIDPQTNLQAYTIRIIQKDLQCKTEVLNFLKEADFNVRGVEVEEIEKELNSDQIQTLGNYLPKKDIEFIEKEKKFSMVRTEFQHEILNNGESEFYSLGLDSQSEGTKRIFGLAGAVNQAISRNAFLPIDEIESKLHPRLIEFLIERFLIQSEESQLLLATHYDNLFDEDDLLRVDNFWFTEKREDGSTDLYRLSNFNGLGRISSLQKAYKFGKFGAVPNID